MARTKKELKKRKTKPKQKRTFKHNMSNPVESSNVRRRNRKRHRGNATTPKLPKNSLNTSSSLETESPCFYIDTNPNIMENSNIENIEQKSAKAYVMGQQARKSFKKQNKNSKNFGVSNPSEITVVPANSTVLNTSNNEAFKLIPNCLTPLSKRDVKHGKSSADKIRQKWRKYTKERLKKATLLTLAGVSPNKKSTQSKATILRLLGDKSNDFGEFNVIDEHDANLLQDLDLIILAASPSEYEAYTKLLRQEYNSLNDESYKQMRLKVLETLLMIPNIFATPEYQAKFETAARNNIKWEINTLKAQEN